MTVTYSITRDTVIKYALQTSGAIGEGDTPSTTQVTETADLLNMLAKTWASDGMPLWSLKTGYILPTTGSSSINLGASSVNSVSSYVTSTLSAAAASGASTITAASISGISSGDAIGVTLSDSTVQWTTVNGAPSGSTITLTATLTGAASSGARFYTYTTTNRITRPLHIVAAYMFNSAQSTRYKVNIVSKDQLLSLGGTTSSGIPNQVAYDPQLGSGVFYIYPQFSGGDYLIQITYHKEFDDFTASSDVPDFPQEFYLPMVLTLGALMGPKYGLSIADRRDLDVRAQHYYDLALSNGQEDASLFIQPDWSRSGHS